MMKLIEERFNEDSIADLANAKNCQYKETFLIRMKFFEEEPFSINCK